MQRIVIVNRSLYWTSYTDCSVTSIWHAFCVLRGGHTHTHACICTNFSDKSNFNKLVTCLVFKSIGVNIIETLAATKLPL